jgi:hypothetical protein
MEFCHHWGISLAADFIFKNWIVVGSALADRNLSALTELRELP